MTEFVRPLTDPKYLTLQSTLEPLIIGSELSFNPFQSAFKSTALLMLNIQYEYFYVDRCYVLGAVFAVGLLFS